MAIASVSTNACKTEFRATRVPTATVIALVCAVVLAMDTGTSRAWAQEAETAPVQETPIRFNFKGATYQQVIDFFSRVTGLPVIWQTPAPEGTLDYISPEGYDQPNALRVLNIILQSKGVMLRVSDDHLYLQKLDQMQRSDVPTFVGKIPAEVTPDQIVTVVRPLKSSLAKPLAERLASMVASYGSVTAMEQQNSIVITETAGNTQRLLTIIDQLDLEDPEGAVEVFSIKSAKASELMIPLRALLSQKVEKFVINQQGHQVKIEEEQMQGLSISADDRTNSIVAKGAQAKIDKLQEAIRLLDVPGTGQTRSIMTVGLNSITPADATARLNVLYQRLPDRERPTVIGMEEAQKVMIIGSDAAITEGRLLLGELDNNPAASESGHTMSVVALENAIPQNVIAAAMPLLNKRQQSTIKMVSGPDGRSLIVAGPAADVESVKQVIPVLDRGIDAPGDIHVLTIENAEAHQLAANIDAMFATLPPSQVRPIVRVDAASNSLLVRATESQMKTIEEIVAKIDRATIASSRQMRVISIDPTKASAAELAQTVQRMLGQGDEGKVKVITLEELLKERDKDSTPTAAENVPEPAKEPSP